jgi:hypothetical protein
MFSEAIVVLVMVAIVFKKVGLELENNGSYTTNRYKTLPCYLALFALAELFEFLMAFDALRMRNIIQLIGISIFHAGLIVMAALQVRQTHEALVQPDSEVCATPNTSDSYFLECGGLWREVEPFLIVVPCILTLSWLIILFWIKALYDEFGWAIFHVVGANPRLKAMYWYYQVMVCLLKFDFFAFTGVTMQLLIVVLPEKSIEFQLTIAAIPVVLILLAFCGTALKREIKWLMVISLMLMLASMTYFVYKLVRFYQPNNPYLTTRATLTLFTIGSLVLLLLTFMVGIRCFADFDQGLREAKTDEVTLSGKYLPGLPSPGRGTMSERQSSYIGGSQMSPRLSIE